MTSTELHSYPLISIREDASVQEAARVMDDCRISALGVLGTHQEFSGIITERDLSRFVAAGKSAAETRVRDIANHIPIVVPGPIDDATALDVMHSSRVRHLIVQEGGDFRIVSMRDLVVAGGEGR